MERRMDNEKVTRTQENENSVIEEVLQQFSEALTSHDVDEIINFYTQDSVMYTLAPPLQGRSDQSQPPAEAINEWLSTWDEGPYYKSQDSTTLQDGNLAVSYRLLNMTGLKTDGAKVDLWFRDTTVLKKESGRWLIHHQHESVPMMMDGSEKAATHLAPEVH